MYIKKLKILVVDDTIVYRKAVSDILSELPGIEVVGVAHNGKIAMSKIKTLKPDLLTLDIEMPEMNGIEVLEQLPTTSPNTHAIMISTLTTEGGDMTMKALELGAFDFILKPNATNAEDSKKQLRTLLIPLIKAFRTSHINLLKKSTASKLRSIPTSKLQTTQPGKPSYPKNKIARSKSEIVTIGISTGGPNALAKMLPKLPGNLGVPIVIVQHMPPIFTQSLANSLNQKCALDVKEAKHGEPILNNTVYIAPGGKQMKLMASADGKNRLIKITNDPPVNSCKPSADYLFHSVADYYVGRATAVIMTGMGSDGTSGLEHLKQKGAFIVAQDEKSCIVFGMPKAPIERGLTDSIVSLNDIAAEIIKSVT
ncbi:MAG: chemotaxis response regulator protein-glutamate methylesterase [Desulfobulbaceae bacterium]|nr:chemotaxis response regulator protein-glutamate methylesterase [Desulfobulbaceae bacterium]